MWVGVGSGTAGGDGGVSCWAAANTTLLDDGSAWLAPVFGSTICSPATKVLARETATLAWPSAVPSPIGTRSGTLTVSGTLTPLTR